MFHFVSPLVFPFVNTLTSFLETLDLLYFSYYVMVYKVLKSLTTHDLRVHYPFQNPVYLAMFNMEI